MIKEKIKYSKYQERIFDEILNTNNNIVVKATAGSGKTFTAIEASKLLYTNQDIIFLAFNKSIIEELKDKLPSHIQCQTIHSLGLLSLISFYKTHLRLNEYKSFMFFEKYLKKLDKKQKFTKFFLYKEALDLIRLTLTDVSYESIMKCCLYYDLYLEDEDISNLILIYKDMEMYNFFLGKENNQIDYVDMIHLPVTQKRIKLQKFDTVIIDELQDMNRTQQEFIKNIIKQTGRFIGIGDDKQCIYSFIGADQNSFNSFSQLPNTTKLPLSISYRCSKSVVNEAKKVYNEIEYSNIALEGEVRSGSVDEINEDDFVVCRNNRPLIHIYFKLIKRGLKCIIKGKDIEKGLISLIIKYKRQTSKQCLDNLYVLLEQKKNKLKEKGVSKPLQHEQYISLKEKVLTIETIIESNNFQHTESVIECIEEMFDENKTGVQLMTIHKSKGLENERVFFLEKYENKKLIPSKYATQPWQLEQERNLLFVAITRAKTSLIYIEL